MPDEYEINPDHTITTLGNPRYKDEHGKTRELNPRAFTTIRQVWELVCLIEEMKLNPPEQHHLLVKGRNLDNIFSEV